MMRRLLALVIAPKDVEPSTSLTLPQLGVLVMLNISHRNCARQRSAMRKFLASSESKLISGGPRTFGRVREELPKWNGAGLANAAGFSQSRPRTPEEGDPLVVA